MTTKGWKIATKKYKKKGDTKYFQLHSVKGSFSNVEGVWSLLHVCAQRPHNLTM